MTDEELAELYYDDGQTFEMLARLSGLSISAVWRRVRRAQRRPCRDDLRHALIAGGVDGAAAHYKVSVETIKRWQQLLLPPVDIKNDSEYILALRERRADCARRAWNTRVARSKERRHRGQ